MVKLLLFVGVLFLFGCGQELVTPEPDVTEGPAGTAMQSSDGASEWEEFSVWVEWDFYNPCADEVLHGSGTSYLRLHTITEPDGSQRIVRLLRVGDDWTLVGATSGDVWLPARGMDSHASTLVAVAPDFTDFVALVERFTFVNQSTGVVMRWPSNIHVVYNGQGELVVDRWVFDPCYLIQRNRAASSND